jgi:SOS-response transcriptional repressor LexA
MEIKKSKELLILINQDIKKDEKQLRKCIKNIKDQMNLEDKVNMQRFKKYLENKIYCARKKLFEIEIEIENKTI